MSPNRKSLLVIGGFVALGAVIYFYTRKDPTTGKYVYSYSYPKVGIDPYLRSAQNSSDLAPVPKTDPPKSGKTPISSPEPTPPMYGIEPWYSVPPSDPCYGNPNCFTGPPPEGSPEILPTTTAVRLAPTSSDPAPAPIAASVDRPAVYSTEYGTPFFNKPLLMPEDPGPIYSPPPPPPPVSPTVAAPVYSTAYGTPGYKKPLLEIEI